MCKRGINFLLIPCLVILLCILTAPQVKAQKASEKFYVDIIKITDNRSQADDSSWLEMDLLLTSDLLYGSKGIEVHSIHAIDSTNRELTLDLNQVQYFLPYTYRPNNERLVEYKISLSSPARDALYIKELTGIVKIYYPERDPLSRIELTNLLTEYNIGENYQILLAQDIRITVLTDEQRKEAAAVKLDRYLNIIAEQGEELDEFELQILQSMSGHSFSDSFNLVLKVEDPQEKILMWEFYDNQGKVIRPSWSTRSAESDYYSYQLKDQDIDEIKMVIYIPTVVSTEEIAFTANNIPLP